MTELFVQGVPAPESLIRSAEIRNNFEALYDKLKTLECRATIPESTSVQVEGGPVYFRLGTSVLYNELGEAISGRLNFINFNTTLINLSTANGFRTIKNQDGTLSRAPITGGISPFTATGLFRELLISLTVEGKLTFTEGATTTTGLSRPFDIAFNDSEIPIAFITIRQSGALNQSGQLQNIGQIDIKEARSFVTPAIQNNLTASEQQSVLEDNTRRISAIEGVIKTTDSLKVQIPNINKLTVDGTNTTNTRIEVLSGSTYIANKFVRSPGALISLNLGPSVDPIPVNNFNKVIVALGIDGDIELFHGSPTESKANRLTTEIPLEFDDGYIQTNDELNRNGELGSPPGYTPLAIVHYRANNVSDISSPPGFTRVVKPIVSEVFVDPSFDINNQVVGGVRFNYAFRIAAINSATEFVVNIPIDVDPNTIFFTAQEIDIFDDNTRSFRREIINSPIGTFDSPTRTMTIQVSETFVSDEIFEDAIEGISLKRNPRVVSLNLNQFVIEDVRPFAT